MLCPTSLYLGRNECIGEEMLCDGSADCPRGEDEDAELCYFFRLVKLQLDFTSNIQLPKSVNEVLQEQL